MPAGHTQGHQGLAGWGRKEATSRQHQQRLGQLLGPWGQVAFPRVGLLALGHGPVAPASPGRPRWGPGGMAEIWLQTNGETYSNLDSIPVCILSVTVSPITESHVTLNPLSS